MKNTFLKHFMVIGSGTLISVFLGFVTTPIITRLVSPSDYGQYSIFTMYSNIMLMVLYLGLDQALVRYFYEDASEAYRRSLLFKCLKFPVLAVLVVSAVLLGISFFGAFEFELGFLMLGLMCIYTFVQIINRFSRLIIRLQYKSKLYSILGIVEKAIYVLTALGLVALGIFDDTISLALAITISVAVSIGISIVKERKIWNYSVFDKNACRIPMGELVKYAYPYVFSMGITTLFQYADKMALNMYCSYEEVGIYSSTMTLVHVFSIVQSTFNTLWAPMAVEHYTKNKVDVSFYQKGNQIISVIMFFIGFSLILVKDVFAVLLGQEYREAAYILPFLIFNPIMYTISETTVNGLVFKKKSNMQVVVSIGACVTNIIGNAILVPMFGCKGAAISTGLSYIVFFSLRTILSNRYFYIDFKLKKFYVVTVFAVLYALYNTFLKFNIGSIVGYAVCVLLLIILYKDTVKFGIKYLIGLTQDVLGK